MLEQNYLGIKTVGRKPSWCRLNSKYHKALTPFSFQVKEVNNAPCGAENPTDKDRLLLKRQLSPPFPLLLRACNLTTIACGRWSLVTNRGEEDRHSS